MLMFNAASHLFTIFHSGLKRCRAVGAMKQDNNNNDSSHRDDASWLGASDDDNDDIYFNLEEGARVQSHYKRKLRCLQNNDTDTFSISQASFDDNDDDDDEASICPIDETNLTLEHWRSLFQELERNTSVNTIEAELKCCKIETLRLLVEYISKSLRLMVLIIKYASPEYDTVSSSSSCTNIPIPIRYQMIISDILRAARQNPAISQLELHTCLGSSPRAIQELLSGNKTLTTFMVEDYHDDEDDSSSSNSKAMAKAIAAGLKGNAALRHLQLFVTKGHLDVMLSGLCFSKQLSNDGNTQAASSSCSMLETLSLSHAHPESNPKLGEMVLQALKCTPSIQRLNIYGNIDDDEEVANDDQQHQEDDCPWIDYVCQNIHRPECQRLRCLVLDGVTFGTAATTSTVTDSDSDSSHAPLVAFPRHHRFVNKTLEKVKLINVKFAYPDAMSMLFNFCGGVKELEIRYDDGQVWMSPAQPAAPIEQAAASSHQEQDLRLENVINNRNSNGAVETGTWRGTTALSSSSSPTDYWADFIRACPKLNRLYVVCANAHHAHANAVHGRLFCSILQGVRRHGSLCSMRLEADRNVSIPEYELGVLLQQVLQETPILRELFMLTIGHTDDMIAGLAAGLRLNTTLRTLILQLSHLQAPSYHVLLESLLENHSLQQLVTAAAITPLDYHVHGPPSATYDAQTSQALVALLVRLFQVNTTLSHIALAPLNLQQGHIHTLLKGFGDRQSAGAPPLNSLDMRNCQLDRSGFIRLTQALKMEGGGGTENPSQEAVACHIVMPSCLGVSLDDQQTFFRNIGQMGPTVKTLDFMESAACLWNDEHHGMTCLKLLLRASQENKNISSFGRVFDFHNDLPIVKEIKYQLKLNHFGRQILDSPNIMQSIWPVVLVPMTKNKTCNKNADALFFFLREFFQRNSYPLSRRHPRPRPTPPTTTSLSSRPTKRSRVEYQHQISISNATAAASNNNQTTTSKSSSG